MVRKDKKISFGKNDIFLWGIFIKEPNKKPKESFDKVFDFIFNALAEAYKLKLIEGKEIQEIEEGIKLPDIGYSINKDLYYKMFYERFDKLLSFGLNVRESLTFIFEPIKKILTIHRVSKWKKGKSSEIYLEIIKYYKINKKINLNNACEEFLNKYSDLNDKYSSVQSLKNSFIEWCNNSDNKLRNHEIFEFLEIFNEREQK